MPHRRTRLIAVAALAVVLLASGCYRDQAQAARDSGAEKPWFCDPTFPNSVTGPGMGTVDFYAGQTRSPLSWDDCVTLGAQMDLAKAYAKRYPTLGDALDAGFRTSFAFIPGMGTHTGRDTMSPELLADPDLNRFDPVIPGIIDSTFKPGEPEFLQYDGNGPDAELVGMSWYVRTTDGNPPEGFVGGNDWWHHHPRLCFRTTDALIISVNASDASCTASGGENLYMHNYYMVHLWVVDDLEYHGDVFAPTHPCITASGAIRDMDDPCHTQNAPAARATGTAGTAAPAAVPGWCPLGTLAEDT